jgi:hypothetical protein
MLRLGTEVLRIAYQLNTDTFTFITPLSFQHSMTRVYAKLLGPCFKTGRIDDRLLHRKRACESAPATNPDNRYSRMRPHPSAEQIASRLDKSMLIAISTQQTIFLAPGILNRSRALKAHIQSLKCIPRRTPLANAPPCYARDKSTNQKQDRQTNPTQHDG